MLRLKRPRKHPDVLMYATEMIRMRVGFLYATDSTFERNWSSFKLQPANNRIIICLGYRLPVDLSRMTIPPAAGARPLRFTGNESILFNSRRWQFVPWWNRTPNLEPGQILIDTSMLTSLYGPALVNRAPVLVLSGPSDREYRAFTDPITWYST